MNQIKLCHVIGQTSEKLDFVKTYWCHHLNHPCSYKRHTPYLCVINNNLLLCHSEVKYLHSIIEIDINLSDFKYGKGYWKFNNSLLKNSEYLKYVTKIIEEEKVKYALPVYNMAHITANNSNIDLTISYDLFFLLMRIRGETLILT